MALTTILSLFLGGRARATDCNLEASRRSFAPSEPSASLTWAVSRLQRGCVEMETELGARLQKDGQSLAAAKLFRRAGALNLLGQALDTVASPFLRITTPCSVSRNFRPTVDASGVSPTGEDVALRICVYLDDHQLVSCFAGTQWSQVPVGSHVLWARAYGLPSGREIAKTSKRVCVECECDNETVSSSHHEKGGDIRLVVFSLAWNGMPFVTRHRDILDATGLDWEWHIVQGLAVGRADANRPYSQIPLNEDEDDGTTKYLTNLAESEPERVHYVARRVWPDKLAMVNRALESILATGRHQERVILMQLDLDELWEAEAIRASASLLMNKSNCCAMFDCHFLVGPKLATTNGYGHSRSYEWIRMWSLDTPWSTTWISHAPPVLAARQDGEWVELSCCVSHEETRQVGAVFTHHAYVKEQQVAFKADFYGYRDAVESWRRLQDAEPPVRLGGYLEWVRRDFPETIADALSSLHPPVIDAPFQNTTTRWTPAAQVERIIRVVVDGVCFQRQPGMGIRRVWTNVLNRIDHAVILRRGGSVLPTTKHETWTAPPMADDFDRVADRLVLAMLLPSSAVLVSTEYTSAFGRPNVIVVHDLTPEKFRWQGQYWIEKRNEVQNATVLLAVSNSTAAALEKYYGRQALVAHNGVDVTVFRAIHKVDQAEYLLWVGPRAGYKNGVSLMKAFEEAQSFVPVWFIGGEPLNDQEARVAYRYSKYLADDDLAVAYSNAVALVYLSRDEGFGLPVLEAMACGCPIIASRIPALLEIFSSERGSLQMVPGVAWVHPPDRLTAIWHAIQSARKLREEEKIRQAIRVGLRGQALRFAANWDSFAQGLVTSVS